MRYVLRKFVEADNAYAAMQMDSRTPVHECALRDEDESPKSKSTADAIGFHTVGEANALPEARRKA